LTVYDFPMREAVIAMKSRQGRGLADFLAPRLHEAFRAEITEADALTYVPVSPGRLHKRGFNQARELAQATGRLSGRTVVDALKMVRPVKDQGRLSINERKANVDAAFSVRDGVKGIEHCRLVLIDDVLTTGATASACSSALKKAGASHVTVLVLALAAHV
jgi:ComF family protein